jgi:hypothetical protein
MTKKWVYWDRYPGLRPLRGLTRGYYLSPFQGWGFETDVFGARSIFSLLAFRISLGIEGSEFSPCQSVRSLDLFPSGGEGVESPGTCGIISMGWFGVNSTTSARTDTRGMENKIQ